LDISAGLTDSRQFDEHVQDAHVVYGDLPRDAFVNAQKLEWIHVASQGVEHMLYPELVESRVLLTNGGDSFSQACAEHGLMLVLALYRKLHLMLRGQGAAEWCTEFDTMDLLCGKTIGCLGTGTIGQRMGRLCETFDCRVLGFSRSGRFEAHFKRVYAGRDGLHELLTRSDIAFNSLPYTPDTHHIMGEPEFDRMKATAVFVNVGRGRTVDQEALVEALRARRIAGAGLDVFEEEPLPPDSLLWQMDNVIVTPHIGGHGGEDEQQRCLDLFIENLRRYVAGKPLLNQVDKRAGY
jgi:phosphoglycerate dehydrogenase-like enzyme